MTTTAPPGTMWTPPPWLNRLMKIMLRTPGLQWLIGRSIALITFEGRRTGKTYTTPVTYARRDGEVVVLTRASRRWPRNLEKNPRVILRLAGRSFAGSAVVHQGAEEDLTAVADFLALRRFDAKGYGVSFEPDGRPRWADVRSLLPHINVIRIGLTERR